MANPQAEHTYESPIEEKLGFVLDSRRIPFETQAQIGRYRADFLLQSKDGRKIVVECDGAQHQEPGNKAHDKARDRYLKEQGYQVLRFSGERIHLNISSVLDSIERVLLPQQYVSLNVAPNGMVFDVELHADKYEQLVALDEIVGKIREGIGGKIS